MTTTSKSTSTNTSPSASNHSILRWQMRGAEDRYDFPPTIWQRAETVSLNRPNKFSEVRFDNDSGTLLCRSGGTIVTVLYAKWEPFEFR